MRNDVRKYYAKWMAQRKPKWMGIEIKKYPSDMIAYQQIIYDLRPDILVECGTSHGGSALYFANIFNIIGHGEVITIDNRKEPYLPRHKRIYYVEGSSVDSAVVEQVKVMVGDKSCMVSLDSSHEGEHVYKELLIYHELVTPGQYMIVEDTNVHEIHPNFGEGPGEAVEKFLAGYGDHYEQVAWKDEILLSCTDAWLLKKGTTRES